MSNRPLKNVWAYWPTAVRFRVKAALTGSTVRQKAKGERRLLYDPILKLQKGMVSGLMKSVMSENQNSQSQVHVTASRYLRFKPRKRGLNSPFNCPEWGGGVLTHYLIT